MPKIMPLFEYLIVTESTLANLQRTIQAEENRRIRDGSVQRFRRTMNVRFGYKRNRREK